jgi:hypothetical protein
MEEWYILVEGRPVREPNWVKAMAWLSVERNTRFAEDWVGDVHVSTIFLGMNHRHSASGPPLLWETMILGGEHDGYQERHATAIEAARGHVEALRLVKGRL